MLRAYKDLVRLPTFEERYRYLRLAGIVGTDTFGFDRYLNQVLYHSAEWRHVRNTVIFRDEGCDLGIPDRVINGKIIVHHMNPLTIKQVENHDPDIFNPDLLICVSPETHNAIHYGDEGLLMIFPAERRPGDTCPWKRKE